jgi:hypothetical protein
MAEDRDPNDIVPLMLRIREDLRRDVERSAKARRVSLNQEASDRLEYVRGRLDLLPEVLALAYGEEIAGALLLVGRAMQTVASGTPWEAGELREAIPAGVAMLQALRSGTAPTSTDWQGKVTHEMLRGLVDPYYSKRYATTNEMVAARTFLASIIRRWPALPDIPNRPIASSASDKVHSRGSTGPTPSPAHESGRQVHAPSSGSASGATRGNKTPKAGRKDVPSPKR